MHASVRPSICAPTCPSFVCLFIFPLCPFPSLLPLGLRGLALGLSPLASVSPSLFQPLPHPHTPLPCSWCALGAPSPHPALPPGEGVPQLLSSPLIPPSLPLTGRYPRPGLRMSCKLGTLLPGFSPNLESSNFYPRPLHTHLECPQPSLGPVSSYLPTPKHPFLRKPSTPLVGFCASAAPGHPPGKSLLFSEAQLSTLSSPS